MVLVKHRLSELIRTFGLERFLPFHMLPLNFTFRKDTNSKPEHMRIALEELGTTFVKVGQILSTRTDILPSDFTEELAKLQSSLTPLPLAVIEKVISDELGRPAGEVFRSFDPDPLGVASIGQAHAAILHDGTEVVVKVRKPGVVEQVLEDLDILRQLAERSQKSSEFSSQYNLPGLVEELADTIKAELDYVREGHTAEHFARLFQGDSLIHIPRIFWQYTTSRTITLERIRGISLLDVAALDRAGFNRKEMARRCVNIWLKMVFEDGMFHADPHPGNLFVEPDGHLGLIDFGMAGIVDDEVLDHLATGVKAVIERDADLLVDSLTDMGAVAPIRSRETLRSDLRHIMGHYPLIEEFQLPYDLGELFAVVRRNGVQLPANTFLLLKTMTMAQSLGRILDKDFDFFQELKSHIEQKFKKRYSPSSIIRRLPSVATDFAIFGAGLPKRLLRIVRLMERGELLVRTDVSGLELHLEHLERIVRMMVMGIILAAVILGATIIFLTLRLGG